MQEDLIAKYAKDVQKHKIQVHTSSEVIVNKIRAVLVFRRAVHVNNILTIYYTEIQMSLESLKAVDHDQKSYLSKFMKRQVENVQTTDEDVQNMINLIKSVNNLHQVQLSVNI
ncbi:Hypothetical_protein [Hexamita inflata]|uniref:Hypothetical_protein n=1 Tax=Hexamita inflata TaxID=28002 RepID=A0AA86PTC2_9EUKA|nr:Hypothetical protein HINF_LOCUS33605 [Hexamita inflata]